MPGTMTRPSEQGPARPAEQLRADARQNHARLISAATTAFMEKGGLSRALIDAVGVGLAQPGAAESEAEAHRSGGRFS